MVKILLLALLAFRFPIHDSGHTLVARAPVVHVDHDPIDRPGGAACINYEGRGFPWCYDEHRGTDWLLAGGFATMDAHGVPVVAAAGGVVRRAVDGNYDRCHAALGSMSVDCDGHPMAANLVELEHTGGWITRYLHLRRGSVAVRVGDRVQCGDRLGAVGSSGRSTGPHLHFEVWDPGGRIVDPFAGSHSQPGSLWVEQGEGGRPGDLCGTVPDTDPPAGGGCSYGTGAVAGWWGLLLLLLAMRRR